MDIPDALRAVYSARLKEENGRYYLTVPARGHAHGQRNVQTLHADSGGTFS